MDNVNVVLASISFTILTGVIAGLVASACYALIKKLISPRVIIDPEIIVHPDEKYVLVKIINRGELLNEIEAELTYYQKIHTDTYSVRIPPNRSIPFSIKKFTNDSKDSHSLSQYAVIMRFTYKGLEDTVKFLEEDSLVFSFKASHSVSGTVKYFNQEFHCNDPDEVIIENDVMFNKGNNTGVHSLAVQ